MLLSKNFSQLTYPHCRPIHQMNLFPLQVIPTWETSTNSFNLTFTFVRMGKGQSPLKALSINYQVAPYLKGVSKGTPKYVEERHPILHPKNKAKLSIPTTFAARINHPLFLKLIFQPNTSSMKINTPQMLQLILTKQQIIIHKEDTGNFHPFSFSTPNLELTNKIPFYYLQNKQLRASTTNIKR